MTRRFRGLLALCLAAATLFVAGPVASPVRAAGTTGPGGLLVSVGYAEDKETNNPDPAAFPATDRSRPTHPNQLLKHLCCSSVTFALAFYGNLESPGTAGFSTAFFLGVRLRRVALVILSSRTNVGLCSCNRGRSDQMPFPGCVPPAAE